MIKRPVWKPWAVEIVGLMSGTRTVMRFIRFWNREAAQKWCDKKDRNPWPDYEPAIQHRPIDLRERKDSGSLRS